MGSKLYHFLFSLALLCSPHSTLNYLSQLSGEWNTMEQKPVDESQALCLKNKPSTRDIIRRVYAVLPYLDREHQNTELLHMYRSTMNLMSEGGDVFDREAAIYTAVLTPLIFLQHYRDAWCLLERFHHAIRRYQASTPAEKRSAIKPLQNLRDLYNKIRLFIETLPVKYPPKYEDQDKTGSFLKDVINNLD